MTRKKTFLVSDLARMMGGSIFDVTVGRCRTEIVGLVDEARWDEQGLRGKG